jgi:ABC-type branched-subunit amino acid transport system ATPase component
MNWGVGMIAAYGSPQAARIVVLQLSLAGQPCPPDVRQQVQSCGRRARGQPAARLGVMTKDPMISVRVLRESYGNTAAVDGVDLDISRGQVMALLGPNGAGKTTTVEILEGYRHRDGGTVTVLGEDPEPAGRTRRWRARIGVVRQLSGELELTVAELAGQFASYYPRPRDGAEVIELVGLRGLERRRAPQLSGGQRRRLDVALGILGRPDLLFLDEPTTGFDPEARRQFWDLIGRLAARKHWPTCASTRPRGRWRSGCATRMSRSGWRCPTTASGSTPRC